MAKLRTLIIALCAATLPGEAFAQVAAQNPPVRKYRGFCFPPDHGDYRKLPEFIPFKSMDDCLKSGGVPPPPRKQLGR